MVITALVMGLLGSLHCIGMCSPLAMAATNLTSPHFVNRVMYNGGRIVTYGILGSFSSSLGKAFFFTGTQHILSLVLGILLILVGLSGSGRLEIPILKSLAQKTTHLIKGIFADFLATRTRASLFVLGSLNGLLPCGLTLLALTYCMTLSEPTDGLFFMLLFGIGTLPAMLGLTSVLQMMVIRFRVNVKKISLLTAIVLGALLISRGIYGTHHSLTASPPDEEIVTCR